MKILLIGGPRDGTRLEISNCRRFYQQAKGESYCSFIADGSIGRKKDDVVMFIHESIDIHDAIQLLIAGYPEPMPPFPELEILDIFTGEKHVIDVDKLPT